MRPRRLRGWIAIAVYATAVVVCPALHLSRHADLPAGHTHWGSPAAPAAPASAPDDALTLAGLADVAAPAAVDCSLAALTLADCETAADGARHFGDDVATRQPAPPPDLHHGAGSLEHLGVSLLASGFYVLPPPPARETRLDLFAPPSLPPRAPTFTHQSRGPPSAV